jgi:hypothetical protein
MLVEQSGGGQWTLPQFSYLYHLYSDEKYHLIVGYNARHSDLRHACK